MGSSTHIESFCLTIYWAGIHAPDLIFPLSSVSFAPEMQKSGALVYIKAIITLIINWTIYYHQLMMFALLYMYLCWSVRNLCRTILIIRFARYLQRYTLFGLLFVCRSPSTIKLTTIYVIFGTIIQINEEFFVGFNTQTSKFCIYSQNVKILTICRRLCTGVGCQYHNACWGKAFPHHQMVGSANRMVFTVSSQSEATSVSQSE